MKAYTVKYNMRNNSELAKSISFLAKNVIDAYDRAVYEEIPNKEGELPYSAWVESVTYNNGKQKFFNTFEGKPY